MSMRSVCAGLAFAVVALAGARPAAAAAGAQLTTYAWHAERFVAHPTLPVIYASLPSLNSVAVIDRQTLAVVATVPIGSNPRGMTLSADGSRLYVANSGSNFVGIIDTATNTTLPSLAVPVQPTDLAFGTNNRLFVLSGGDLRQVDATTGASAGPNLGSNQSFIGGGAIRISPDRQTLYHGGYGSSPTYLTKFNVATSTPTVLKAFATGSNGQDLELSTDGAIVSHPNGAPYEIAVYRTSDLLTLGTLNTGAYPREVAFSPDARVAYAVHTSGQIDVFDLQTYLSLPRFAGSSEADELFVDPTGRYLFASYADASTGYTGTRVYDTGRVAVPEPGTAVAAGLAAAGGLLARRRRKPVAG
jgi:YVTN family beta-propeller protein